VTGQYRPTRFLKCVRSDLLVSRGAKREVRERERKMGKMGMGSMAKKPPVSHG